MIVHFEDSKEMKTDKEEEFIRQSKEWYSLSEEERVHRMRMVEPIYAMRVKMQQSSILPLDKIVPKEG